MKTASRILLVLCLLLTACQFSAATGAGGTPGAAVVPTRESAAGACGDGVCNGPETSALCPADCPGAETQAPAPTKKPAPAGDQPMYLTTMTHMEHGWEDDTVEAVFLQHVEQLRYGLGLANEYDAKFTIESELPFVTGARIWKLNILREVLDLGHGVGTHSDIGFRQTYTLDELTREFRTRKAAVDALVGAGNNRGTSGGGCPSNWVTAASRAGFVYMDGVVGMHLLAVPLSERPGPEWTDEYILSVGYHQDVPPDLADRMYPFPIADTKDFEPDPDGVLILLMGDIGRLDYAAEGGADACRKPDSCALTNADTDSLAEQIRYADSIRDRSKIAKLTIYIPANLFDPANEAPLRYFLMKMKELADQGVIVWATQGEVYDSYMGS